MQRTIEREKTYLSGETQSHIRRERQKEYAHSGGDDGVKDSVKCLKSGTESGTGSVKSGTGSVKSGTEGAKSGTEGAKSGTGSVKSGTDRNEYIINT